MPVKYREDVINRYLERKKGISYEEADDLLNCALKFLSNELKTSKDSYAFGIPKIGTIYRPYCADKLLKNEEEHRFIDECFSNKFNIENPTKTVKESYNGKTWLEIEKLQNDS